RCEELVVPRLLRHKVAAPTNREMIDWLARGKAAFSPIEVNVLVCPSESSLAFQFCVAEVLRLQPGLAIRSSEKFRIVKDLVKGRGIDRIENPSLDPQAVTDAFEITDGTEGFGFSAATSTHHSGVGIRTNHSDGFHFVFIQRKQAACVLQQDHAASRHFESDLPALLAVGRNGRIGLRLVEETELDRLPENSSDLVVHDCERNPALINCRKQEISVHERGLGHFKIEATVGRSYTIVRRSPVGHEDSVK